MFRNHGPQDPNLYKKEPYAAFSTKVNALFDLNRTVTHQEFLELSAEALRVKQAIPELRADIAYDMVCVSSSLPERQQDQEPTGAIAEIADLFADLEVPDGHVVSREAADRGDFSGVDEKWHRIEELLQQVS